MNFESLILDRRDGVATITLNRPDAFNALTLGLGRELFHAALEVDEDPTVRCVVVTGAGRAFCAGGDVRDFADNLEHIGVLIKELTTYLHGAISRFCRSDKPVIMAVNGIAAGGGLSLALSGDLVVATESAKLTMRSEEHTSELQSPCNLVCRLLLEKKTHPTSRATHRAYWPPLLMPLPEAAYSASWTDRSARLFALPPARSVRRAAVNRRCYRRRRL